MPDKLLQEILKVLKNRPDEKLKDITAAARGAGKMHDALDALTLGALFCPDNLRETVGEMLEAIQEELKLPMSLDCEKEHGHGLN